MPIVSYGDQQIRMNYLVIIKIDDEVRNEASAYPRYVGNRKAMTPLIGRQRPHAAQ